MSISSAIEWTDSSWNAVRGCRRVSEGCRNCYAERQAYRFSGPGQPFEGLVTLTNGRPTWTGRVAFIEKHLLDPMKWGPVVEHTAECSRFWDTVIARWKKEGGSRPRRDYTCECLSRRRIIFVNSVSDLFHESIPTWWQDQIFAVMAMCGQHSFIVLTKRAERMYQYFSASASELQMRWGAAASYLLGSGEEAEKRVLKAFPLPNVALGVSIEDQDTASLRVPFLLKTPAAYRLVSAEPLLGPLDLTAIRYWDEVDPDIECEWNALTAFHQVLHSNSMDAVATEDDGVTKLDWVICGGESGQDARPMHPAWALSLRNQCQSTGVPYFFKQWGEWWPGSDARVRQRVLYADGRSCEYTQEAIREEEHRSGILHRVADPVVVAKIGKKAAGDLLDGQQWHQYPKGFLYPDTTTALA